VRSPDIEYARANGRNPSAPIGSLTTIPRCSTIFCNSAASSAPGALPVQAVEMSGELKCACLESGCGVQRRTYLPED